MSLIDRLVYWVLSDLSRSHSTSSSSPTSPSSDSLEGSQLANHLVASISLKNVKSFAFLQTLSLVAFIDCYRILFILRNAYLVLYEHQFGAESQLWIPNMNLVETNLIDMKLLDLNLLDLNFPDLQDANLSDTNLLLVSLWISIFCNFLSIHFQSSSSPFIRCINSTVCLWRCCRSPGGLIELI